MRGSAIKAIWLLPVLASTVLAADVSGKWSGNIELQGDISATADIAAEFSQTSDAVTGKIGRENDESEPIRNGKLLDGKHLLFEVKYPDADGSFKFELALNGDRLEGTMTGAMEMGPVNGKVHLTRAKQTP